MKIGLFFGSFDPVHVGHTMIISKIIEQNFFNQIWIILSPQSPHKDSLEISEKKHRLIMLKKAFFDQKNVIISTVEFGLSKPNFTINTLTFLMKEYPHYIFSIIMGSDNFFNINTWKSYEEIINNYKIYIYPRKGFEIDTAQFPNIIYLPFSKLEVSSTLIRTSISNKDKTRIQAYLPKSVLEYIVLNKIY